MKVKYIDLITSLSSHSWLTQYLEDMCTGNYKCCIYLNNARRPVSPRYTHLTADIWYVWPLQRPSGVRVPISFGVGACQIRYLLSESVTESIANLKIY